MATLSRELRKRLENVVTEARDVGEDAAMKALRALAIADREAHRSLIEEQKALRSRLRAHGRQLGDSRDAERGTQAVDHLVAECAYEHWHRMLFARFLAENQLLLEPESGVAIAIEEVKELARSRGKDWVAVAGEFAVRMLPQVFRQDDPVLEVQFAPEDKKHLEDLLESLPSDVFTATDSLGWTYQFWQTERKNEINASGEKIGADELPAVTQLFTEDYMVDFLLDNTLGAWHAGKILAADPKLSGNAKSEEELRKDVALPGCSWNYLRFVKDEAGTWTPAAGTFDGWPKAAKDLRCLDPCMGSGHFVVAMFERLIALRMAEEQLDEATTAASVIRDNLFGLEIDPRCTQIAAFNLAVAAWRRVGYRPLPAMNLACSGLAPNARQEDWLRLAGDNEPVRRGMGRLFSLFSDAPLLGSLINPRGVGGDLLVPAFQELQPLLQTALAREIKDESAHEIAVTARGVAKAAETLSGRFALVGTNVPYLGRGKQDEVLKEYCERVYPEAKGDLATCFVERCLAFCSANGSTALVTPQNWLYQDGYKRLRKRLLAEVSWNAVAQLGEHAFDSSQAAGAFVAMVSLTRASPTPDSSFAGFDVLNPKTPDEKSRALVSMPALFLVQHRQLSNPDGRVMLVERGKRELLSSYASSSQGIKTGDDERVSRKFWELARIDQQWKFYQGSVLTTRLIGGMESVISWADGGEGLARKQGMGGWGRRGVMVSQMRSLPVALYYGDIFDSNASPIVVADSALLPALWAFCSSDDYFAEVRKVDQSLKPTNKSLVQIPFDLAHWQKVAAEKYPHGLPKPQSSDPTQWLFDGCPSGSEQPLQVAIARLLDYRWPRQTGSSFSDCPGLGPDDLEKLAESDGIVCLSAIKGEAPADERLREVLARAYGKEWDAAVLDQLLAQVGFSGETLTDWVRDGFFEQHCALFHQRPFIWHIWDGERDGFHALVNYHKLTASDGEGRKTLEKLTYSYLGDWVTRQKAEQKQVKEGADAKLAAALHLQEELKKILEGEPPYDLFVRWKPLHEQAVGWAPDINDGVRINIRPFMTAETLTGKSIFRKVPKIKWDKDRGKEPNRPKRDFPWFWSWDEEIADFKGGPAFDGNRWNELHYSNEMKEAALAGAENKR